MGRKWIVAMACLIALDVAGCGGSASSTHRKVAPAPEVVEDGVGMSAPIRGYVVARRHGPAHIQPGPHILDALPCFGGGSDGVAMVGLFSDTPEPKCLRVSPGQRILVVNRSGAFFRHEEGPAFLRLGDYTARIGPQQAALFPAPVGTYLGLGLHEFGGHSVVATPGVLVVRPKCNRHPGGIRGPLSPCF
jgi:hypothetical protein